LKKYNIKILWVVLGLALFSCRDGEKVKPINTVAEQQHHYLEEYRPQFHFSPPEKWMNDPNGLVYNKGIYHLFINITQKILFGGLCIGGMPQVKIWFIGKINLLLCFLTNKAIFFLEVRVIDTDNSSGLGSVDNPPLVAIFTYHKAEWAEEGRIDFQTQGIAYSLDNGDTWVKYEGQSCHKK